MFKNNQIKFYKIDPKKKNLKKNLEINNSKIDLMKKILKNINK